MSKKDHGGGIANTVKWFNTIYSATPISQQKINAQFGTHFEEVAEMLAAIKGVDRHTEALIASAAAHLVALADHLKNANVNKDTLLSFGATPLADALGDQIVTSVGCGTLVGIDMVGVVDEINRSNFSKFDENGQPVFKEGGKVGKSHLYSSPKLGPFIK